MSLIEYEEFDVVGKWWVPGRNQPSHPGRLVVSQNDDPALELLDDLGFLTKPADGTYTDRSFHEFFPIVCGLTQLGPATLINYQQGQADFLVFDILLEAEEDALFNKIRLEIKHLPEWIGQPILHRTLTFWKDGEGEPIGNELVYKYRTLPDENFQSVDLDFKLFFGLSANGSEYSSVTLTPKVYLDVSSDAPRTLQDWWLEVIRPLRDLFSLAVDQPTEVVRFSVFIKKDERDKECRVYFKRRKVKLTNKDLATHDMLFSRRDLLNGLGGLMDSWFGIIKDLPMFANLYSSVTRDEDQYLEQKFLSLAQAIEVYHRYRFERKIAPPPGWTERSERIVKVALDSDKSWLKKRLKWSSEPRLRDQLLHILKALRPATNLLVVDINGFSEKVKKTRHYYTHWDSRREKDAVTYPEIYFVTNTLRYLVAGCLLLELGFDPYRISELFKRNHRIHNFIHNADNPISNHQGKTTKSTFYSIQVQNSAKTNN
ncbi:HEPN domain-containing protein [Thiococcus pfennigii]|uniref:ApeA N-terminal domain 1-containing protein n=1 Tax=Thiococcus pfennigii TaxID=1057 RepID=UPI00190845BD|nr:HEPN domain-containing protein [Thiococcus pfennigii]